MHGYNYFDKKPLVCTDPMSGSDFEDIRTPYAAIYTSLGCIYGCEFCMINIVNRTDNSDQISSGDIMWNLVC